MVLCATEGDKLKRAIATFGVGKCAAMLNIARPSFRAFANKHGYDLIATTKVGLERPPAWYKLPMLQDLLADYDEVLWLDSDTVIVDGCEDVCVPSESWQALVVQRTYEGEIPNLGIWLVRRAMLPYLQRAWELEVYIHHPWWENAAVMALMGYDPVPPVKAGTPTELSKHTYRLNNSWNATPLDQWAVSPPRIQHIATCYTNVLETMAGWAESAKSWMEE